MVPLMIGMTLIAFVVSHSVPADPVAAHLGQRSMEDPAIVAAFRQQWGLDKPLPEQYLTYVRNLVQGNFGVSIRTHTPVAEDLARYLLASVYLGLVTRMTRSSMLEVLSAEYVRTARGKGLRERVVMFRHALVNALIPTVTVLGLAFGDILAGTVLTETIFSWPGIGRYAYQSAVTLDFPSIMGVSLVIAAVFITVNLATDLAYVMLDPRLRRT